MNATRIVAIVLIVAGILGLAYGGFSYTKEETQAKIGPLELRMNCLLYTSDAADEL